MYEQKVRDSIYTLTGRSDTDTAVVKHVQQDLHSYLSRVKQETIRLHAKRKRDKQDKGRIFMLDDFHAALEGTPEHYGARRCLIVKKLARAVSTDDKPGSADSFQAQLAELNDGSESFSNFERHRLQDLHHADQLTKNMSSDDYQIYSAKKRKASFTSGGKQFCQWLDWNPQPNPTIVTAMGWLATYRIKRVVYDGLARSEDDQNQLTLDLLS